MQIIVANHIGFCDGVQRSVDMVFRALAEKHTVYGNHPLIHNRDFLHILQRKGYIVLHDIHNLPYGSTAVISAHGASEKVKNVLREKGANILDATCPFVKKVHDEVLEKAKKGWRIILFGDKQHAEIVAIKEDFPDCQIVLEPEEIDFSGDSPYFILTQTTFDIAKAEIFRKKIKKIATDLQKTVVFFNSICYTTIQRQSEAIEIARKSDITLVIGDKTSSNTQKLITLCQQYCAQTQLIENVNDIHSLQIENTKKVLGIISAASARKELIMEVYNRMSELNTTDKIVEETGVTEEVTTNAVAEKEQPIVSMEEAMKKYGGPSYHLNQRVTVKVTAVDPSGISVVIENGGKNDSGFISKDEAEADGAYDPANYNIGDELKCMVIRKEAGDKSHTTNLSKKKIDIEKIDDEKVQKILAGEEFTLNSFKEVNGGLLGHIGSYSVFVPASQIRLSYVKNLSEYTNKTLRLVALPPKEEPIAEEGDETAKKQRNPKRIVASQKVILAKEKEERDNAFWSGIYEGAIVNGKVKRFTNFGVFVSLKYMDALVRLTDLSWSKKRVTDPGEILELNKNYDFIVLSVDREKEKIGLGYKQLQKKPYEIAQEKYPVGSVLTGKVARLVKFGAFVELEPGIDGLVHISQIKNGWIANASDVLKEGDEVQVKVLGYEPPVSDEEDGRITLSIKELLPDEPEVKAESEEKPTKDEKKGKRAPKEAKVADDEPREYISGNRGATFGDLFKNIDFADDENK